MTSPSPIDMQGGQILTTKLHIPQLRATLVPRPRLLNRLDEGFRHKLALVSAPAGFGKTTLLNAWINQRDRPVAWLSLDQGDNDPARFWTYVTTALDKLRPDAESNVRALLQSLRLSSMEPVITLLINELAELPTDFALVLDDYHLIHRASIHGDLAFLLEHLPAQMHLVIASRVDPLLPLGRLRSQAQLVEIRADELRFTAEEAKDYLKGIMSLSLSADEVHTLKDRNRTEGWIAGLQLAALSLQEHEEPSEFIHTFAGDDRYILDYLMDEVFAQQPESVQRFLLKTSILERFSAPLCDAVVEENGDSQGTLESLEKANLFIVPLDSKREWYRYHHLFADLLRHRLKRSRAQHLPELHRRAARWFEAQGLADEALPHILAAADLDWAARLVEQIGTKTLWGYGEVATLLGWLERLPRELVHSRPRLSLLYAWAMYQAGRLDTIGPFLRSVESYLQEAAGREAKTPEANLAETPTSSIESMLGEVAAIRAFVARMQGELPQAIEFSHQALHLLPEHELHLRGITTAGLAEAYFLSGDLTAARPAYLEAGTLCLAANRIFPALFVLRRLGEVQMLQGHLHQAADTYRQMQEVVERQDKRHVPGAGLADILKGELLREWNELNAAAEQLQTGIERGKKVANARIFLFGYVSLARVRQAQGEEERALEAIQEALDAERRYQVTWGWGVPPAAAYRARLWLAHGKLAAAAQWAAEAGLAASDEPTYRLEVEYLTLARVLLAQRKAEGAARLLMRICQAAEAGGRTGRVIEALVLLALAHQSLGNSEEALSALERAFALAEPEGYIRLFIDEGEPMARLLRQAPVAPDYASKLLAALPPASSLETMSTPRPPDPLAEPLSEREMAILRLIVARQTDKEIARALSLSVNTVKWHARNIYAKLGVYGRHKAAVRARELGIF